MILIAMLDDNEALVRSGSYTGTPDIAIGRFPVTTPTEAKILVDKTISYAENKNVGDWQNIMMFLGDDGDNNLHMTDINSVADSIIKDFPGYNVKKVYWDAYKRTMSATGNRYPEVENIIKTQQKNGALIMDYVGHGAPESISHEYVLRLTDFEDFRNTNLPLWITASCDVGPFDGNSSTIGETVILNEKGGGVAFFGTTRTVLAFYNKYMNDEFLKALLTVKNGKRTTLGEANMIAKTQLATLYLTGRRTSTIIRCLATRHLPLTSHCTNVLSTASTTLTLHVVKCRQSALMAKCVSWDISQKTEKQWTILTDESL